MATPQLDINAELGEVIQKRISLFRTLEAMDARRRQALKDNSLPDDAKFDYQRQQREVRRIPSAEQARISMDKLKTRLARMMKAAEAGDGEPVSPKVIEAFKMAMQQWTLFIEWHGLARTALEAGLKQASGEPLLKVFASLKIPATELFGWTFYMLGLDAVKTNLTARLQRQKDEYKKLDDPEAPNPATETAALVEHVQQEQQAVEPIAVEAFWKAYESASQWWVAGKVPENALPYVRAFLRWGLVGSGSGVIDPSVGKQILSDCVRPIETWSDSMDSTDILYADEYLWYVGRGAITPSFDEDLELNRRNSPEWNADKAHRRIIHTRIAERAQVQQLNALIAQIMTLRRKHAKLEAASEKEKQKKISSRVKLGKLREQMQELKVESGRLERVARKVKAELIPRQRDVREQAKAKLQTVASSLTRKSLVTREVAGIRKICKLVNKLKEPLLPVSLREHFRPGSGVVNLRDEVAGQLALLEQRDPTVFKVPLMHASKRSQTMYLRYSPTIILTPAVGFQGFCWNPRAGSEVGKLVIPGYCPRGGLLEQIFIDILSDFRWDSSKASAGVDAMNSDTLVAGYTTVRWNYRKRGKDIREKAAIYNDENDKMNWRRHYTLYMNSAEEGGKRLFHKCKDVYDVLVRYIDLPEGVERLRA